MKIDTPLADALTRYLDLNTRQMQMTASNMANIDTPGYKTQGMDFEGAFADALNGRANHSEGEVENLVSRPDGNNVSIDRESMQLAKTQLQFRTGVELLRHQMTLVSEAIKSDGK